MQHKYEMTDDQANGGKNWILPASMLTFYNAIQAVGFIQLLSLF